MPRIEGASHKWLFARVDELDAAMATALHAVVKQLSPHLTMKAVTAAGFEDNPNFPDPSATVYAVPIDWQGLTIIQSLWLDQVAYNLMPKVYEAYEMSAGYVRDDILHIYPDVEDDLPGVTSAGAEEYFAQAKNRMVGVGDKLWNTIHTELQAGVAKGESIDELKARLVQSAGLSEPRARTVARTEVIGSANAGSFAQARLGAEAGLTMTKEWLATEDQRTRPTHHAADGQQVGLEDHFIVGGSSLMFPGDPTGPADEIINCRCTITYDVSDEEPLAITAGGPKMSTGTSFHWDGLAHAEFCKSPLHPGPCKGAHPSVAKKTTKKHAAPTKHAAAKKTAPVGGGASEGGGLTSQEALTKSFPSPEHTGAAGLSSAQKQKIYEDFKGHKGVSPAYSGKAIYESMQHAKAQHPELDLSDADVLSIIDEHGTLMGHTAKAGPSAYTDKVTSWLQTPGGKKIAAEHLKTTQGHIPHEPNKISHADVTPPPSHEESLKAAVSSTGPGASIIDDVKASKIPSTATDEDAYKHLATIADKHGISVEEAGALYDTYHGTNMSSPAISHMKKYGLESLHGPLPEKSDFDADISHLTAGHIAAVGNDFDAEFYNHGGDVLAAAEVTGQKYGLSPLQVTKAADQHFAGYDTNYTAKALAQVGLELPPPPPPPSISKPAVKKTAGVKKTKTPAANLPVPSDTTGYKSLPEHIKVDLGDSGTSHIPFEKKAEIVNDAKKSGVSYLQGDSLDAAVASVAEKHGVSKLQVAQVYDKYAEGKKKPWDKKTPNHVEKSLFKAAKASAASKDPLSTDGITPAKLKQLGSSDISDIADIQKKTIIDAAATQYISVYHDPKTVFSTAQKLGQHLGFSPHQVAKILDEADAAKLHGGVNQHTYEQKILKLAKTGTLPKAQTVYGSTLTHGGYHLVKPPENSSASPGTHFAVVPPTEVAAMQHQMNATHGSWTAAQEGALATYTTSYYKHMNGYLRSGGQIVSSAGVKQKVDQLQSAMRPITQDIVVHRGADHLGFGLKSASEIPSLVGKTYEDRGFLSTSVGGKAAFGGSVKLTIHVPKGTHAAYVGAGINGKNGKPLSHFHHENELILAAGTKYKVVSATQQTVGVITSWDVVVEVVA